MLFLGACLDPNYPIMLLGSEMASVSLVSFRGEHRCIHFFICLLKIWRNRSYDRKVALGVMVFSIAGNGLEKSI